MTTGERIKEARLKKGLSQEELGKLIGVQKAAVNKYETGLVVNLKRDMIAKLAKALDVSPVWLMCMENKGKEKSTGEKTDGLSKEESELIQLFRRLSAERQREYLVILQALIDTQQGV